MYTVRVKDRGRDLAVHHVDRSEEARQLARVYEVIGYAPDKVIVERQEAEKPKAA